MHQKRQQFFTGFIIAALAAFLGLPGKALAFDSGQRTFGQASVEPSIDDSTGGAVYLLTPTKAPDPTNNNPKADAPLYLVVYPLSSAIPASELNCQPTNCDHVNVLPFPNSDYGALSATDKACVDFNSGSACSSVKGHDHLVGIASTGGDFNVAWHVKLVFFTHDGFTSGKTNTRITTLSQLQALVNNGDVVIADTPITFHCSRTSEATYDKGTPVVIPYP
jgi:hypothetical protein